MHLLRAGIDYTYSIAKINGIEIGEVEALLEEMMHMGLVEKKGSSSIKRSDDAFKRSHEVHKHHTYYGLTRLGEITIREVKKRALLCAERIKHSRLGKDIERGSFLMPNEKEELKKMGILFESNGNFGLTVFGEMVSWYIKEGDKNN